MKEFGKRLAVIIEDKGLKQNEFCAAIEYSPQKLSNVLTGKTLAPRIDLLYAIAKTYSDVNIRWLLIGEGEKNITEQKTTITQTQYQDLLQRLEKLANDFEEFKNE